MHPVHFGAAAVQPQAGATSATIDVIPIGGGATAHVATNTPAIYVSGSEPASELRHASARFVDTRAACKQQHVFRH